MPSGGRRQSPGGIFPLLLLTGRPASGKSEILEYLRRTPAAERRRRFRIGELAVLDDFPCCGPGSRRTTCWPTWAASACTPPPKATSWARTCGTCSCAGFAWNTTSSAARTRSCMTGPPSCWSSPGERSTGATPGPSPSCPRPCCERLAVIYVHVSFQESLRKNRRRFNPERPHSILEHGLPDEKLARLYREDDWGECAAADSRFLAIRGRQVPYAVFENEDDLTTPGGEPLGQRLEKVLGGLWTLAAGGEAFVS